MFNDMSKHVCLLSVSICLIFMPVLQSANAAVISTDTAIEIAERHDRISHINEILARESVQSMLIEHGVEPADAMARVDALSDSELRTLEGQLDKLPSGGTGIVEVVGIVAIVLIVLELLNVTNFFNEF